MTVYLDLVVLLNFGVDFLLLMGTNRLCGYPLRPMRTAAAALVGGLYAGWCVIPGFFFMGSILWRLVALVFMSGIAFGFDHSGLRRGILFVFLSMALGGMAVKLESDDLPGIVLSAVALLGMCFVGFRGRATRSYETVTLVHRGKKRQITALRDTGNGLKDPITGEAVLVVGSDVATEMLGIAPGDLQDPLLAMEKRLFPGLRLIPYCSVGNPHGLLLAMRMDEVMLDRERVSDLVAFAPEPIGRGEGYQALAGGIL